MGLGQALTSAVSGLRVTQTALSIVSGNIANAQTPGYIAKGVTQVSAASGGTTIGVRLSDVNRTLDTFLQTQLRTENGGGTYTSTLAGYYTRLQSVFGQPGAANALATTYNNFISAAQTLSTSPDSTSARYAVLTAGQSMAQQLNGMTANIQGLRSQAELQISDTVTQANNDMAQIAAINGQLGQMNTHDATFATLQDKRDSYIDDLSKLVNITVTPTDNNKVNIFTGAGTQLVGDKAVLLKFDAQGSLTPQSVWSADPTKRGVGTITIDQGNNLPGLDLIANGFVKSGKLAALLQMRDQVLTQAQGQIDQIAGAVSSALSDKTVQGTAVTGAGQNGFDIDLGTLQNGNTVNITYTDSSGKSHNLTVMRVDDPSVLPLPKTAVANANNNQVVGVNFANGMPSVLTQIQNALGTSGVRFYNPSGTTLRVLDDGAGGQVKVNTVTSTSTITSMQSGNAQLPFFLDGSNAYTGAITNAGPQSLGLAGRIAINPALMADPTKLIAYLPTTTNADTTRPNYMLNQLTAAVRIYAPQAGVGSVLAPFSGTISSYLQQMLSQQGQDASNADNLNQGQQVVVNSLQQKFNSQSGVNIDTEMANLLQLQTTYSANARVITTIKDMINALLQI